MVLYDADIMSILESSAQMHDYSVKIIKVAFVFVAISLYFIFFFTNKINKSIRKTVFHRNSKGNGILQYNLIILFKDSSYLNRFKWKISVFGNFFINSLHLVKYHLI